MPNANVLNWIGDILGSYIRLDKAAVRQKAHVPWIRLVHDVKRWALRRRTFLFSLDLTVDLELEFEKCLRLCKACRFFDHGGDRCDKALMVMPKTAKIEPKVALMFAVGSGSLGCVSLVVEGGGWNNGS